MASANAHSPTASSVAERPVPSSAPPPPSRDSVSPSPPFQHPSPAVPAPSSSGGQPSAVCGSCKKVLATASFSTSQLKKKDAAKCADCVKNCAGGVGRGGGGGGGDGGRDAGKGVGVLAAKKSPSRLADDDDVSSSVASLSLSSRPQMDIPGFPGLTCCRDWPQTKRGQPPAAQSLIFNPLLACVFGPIPGHCTSSQLDFASSWWSAALPAWPRWVAELRAAGVPSLRDRFLQLAKGSPNLLVPKGGKGAGTVPHFRGKDQTDALERGGMVAIECYAAITCMYSQAALNGAEGGD